MEESEHIKKLEELVPKLGELVISNSPDVEYDVENGSAFGFNLYNIPEVAVQRVFMSKETKFPKHCHLENEYILVYKGSLKVTVDKGPIHANVGGISTYDKDMILGVGDGVFFPSEVSHTGESIVDTWLICITIPSADGYPYDK